MNASGVVLSAMEHLSQAVTTNIVPNQEYLLQGSILDTSVEHLVHRLRGLCDNVDTGPESFNDHEISLSLRLPNQPASTPPILMVRVRKALDVDAPYQLRYVGQSEIGGPMRPTIVRSSLDIACTASVVEFLTGMGFATDFEYINRGRMFRKGRMKITVSKVYKVNGTPTKAGETNSESISQSHLVELSVLAQSGQDAIAEDMRAFAEQLKPLVNLEKIDCKRL